MHLPYLLYCVQGQKGDLIMAVVGYVRVSTQEQNTGRQELALKDCDRLFIEKVSGKDTAHRKQLAAMLDYVREGDTVKVESYSRFARNTKDLLTLIDKLDQKGVHFISIKEQIDTTTPQGRLMLTILQGWHSLNGNRRCSVRERV